MLRYRTYGENDFTAVLRLLTDSHEFDTIDAALLKEKLYLDPEWNPETCFIAENEEGIVGFLQGVKRNIRKENLLYIKLLAVDSNFRREGIATGLLDMLEAEARETHCKKIKIYDVPLNYFMPGIDPRYTPAVCFAKKNNFKRVGEAINMEVDLAYSDWDVSQKIEALRDNGIYISRAEKSDREGLDRLLDAEWKLWKFEVDMAYMIDPIAVHVAKMKDEIVAFSAYDGNNAGTGWFGPMGTHEKIRGYGIGRVLLSLCLADMKKQGHGKAIIPWVAPIAFYANYAGANISRIFWRYEKEIN